MPEDFGVDATDGGDEFGSDEPATFDSVSAAFEAAAVSASEDDGTDGAPAQDGSTEASTDEAPPGETQKFTVKVDGEELQVELDELLNGYQRQADYTAKTQAVAQERHRLEAFQALESALASDPKGTLSELAKAYGVNLDASPVETDEYQEPWEAELAALRKELEDTRSFVSAREQAEQRQAAMARVDAEFAQVKAQFGDDDVSYEQLVEYAVEKQIGSLEAAYKAYRFDNPVTPTVADKSSRDDTVLEAKRAASFVEGGSSVASAAASSDAPAPKTIRESWLRAKNRS